MKKGLLSIVVILVMSGCKIIHQNKSSEVRRVGELTNYSQLEYIDKDSEQCKGKNLGQCLRENCGRIENKDEIGCLAYTAEGTQLDFGSGKYAPKEFRVKASFSAKMFYDFIIKNKDNSELIRLNNLFCGVKSLSEFKKFIEEFEASNANFSFTITDPVNDVAWAKIVRPLWNEYIKNFPVDGTYVNQNELSLNKPTILVIGKSSWVPTAGVAGEAHIDAHLAEFDGKNLKAGISRSLLEEFKKTNPKAEATFKTILQFDRVNSYSAPSLDRIDIISYGYDTQELASLIGLAKELTALIRKTSSQNIKEDEIKIIELAKAPDVRRETEALAGSHTQFIDNSAYSQCLGKMNIRNLPLQELYKALAVIHSDNRLEITSLVVDEKYRTRGSSSGCEIIMPQDISAEIGGGDIIVKTLQGDFTLEWGGNHILDGNTLSAYDWLYGKGAHAGFYFQLKKLGKIK